MNGRAVKEKDPVREALLPHIHLGFNYNPRWISGKEVYGECLFCGAGRKLYVNYVSKMWQCKSCGRGGNYYNFLEEYYKMWKEEVNNPRYKEEWIALANERQIDPRFIRKCGVIYDGTRFIIPFYYPIKSKTGGSDAARIVTFQFHTVGQGIRNFPGESSLWGAEKIPRFDNDDPIYVCEKAWDAIALDWLLQREKIPGIVVGTPGANTWKHPLWTELIAGKNIVGVWDNDGPGETGLRQFHTKVIGSIASLSHVNWKSIDILPNKFDVRDFITRDGNFAELNELVEEYIPLEEELEEKAKRKRSMRVPISSGMRPPFEDILGVYKKYLDMDEDMVNCLKITYAIILTSAMEEEPLWIHIVSPGGSGKSVILMSAASVQNVVTVSSVTNSGLVSGFVGKGKTDISLIPKLTNKTLIAKDWTEILSVPKMFRDQLYGTLRGAFDGTLKRNLGNVTRDYKNTHFNVATGVTHAIFGERNATLGERFLFYHMVKGDNREQREKIVRAAIKQVGNSKQRGEELETAARSFLDVIVQKKDVPEVPGWAQDRIVKLALIVASMRASVERDQYTGKIMYCPQAEMPTRVGKQLVKLIQGLGLLNDPPSIGEEEYKIVSRVAMDSCIGYNLDPVLYLIRYPNQTIKEITTVTKIPEGTLRDHLNDLLMLEVVQREIEANPKGVGAPLARYSISEWMIRLWEESRIARDHPIQRMIDKSEAIKRKVRRSLGRK